jgi:hypothetical protein
LQRKVVERARAQKEAAKFLKEDLAPWVETALRTSEPLD